MMTSHYILQDTSHRPWPVPKGNWKYYQEWNNALFLHWEVPFDLVRKHVPDKLTIDTFEGKTYISLVAFTMQNIRPRYLPAFAPISDFEEINIRTYIDIDGKKGVYFLNMEAAKSVSAYISRKLSGLPYEKAVMHRTNGSWRSENSVKQYYFSADFEVLDLIDSKTALEKWLTERYCLYMASNDELYRYEVHHCEWPLKNVRTDNLQINYHFGELILDQKPDLVQYSEGVSVYAWGREKLLQSSSF